MDQVKSQDQTIYQSIETFIVERYGIQKKNITSSLDLRADLGADSLDFVELVMELEDVFQIQIHDQDFDQLRTIDDLVNYIKNNRQ